MCRSQRTVDARGRRRRTAVRRVVLGFLWSTGFAWSEGSVLAPGAVQNLTDWRWLARPVRGSVHVLSDLRGERQLESSGDDRFVVLDTRGPGVVDHLLTRDGHDELAVEVDGRLLWRGRMATAAGDVSETALFPPPILFAGGGFYHLLAPIGFQHGLRITSGRARCRVHVAYRTFAVGTEVVSADPAPDGLYARELRAAAGMWNLGPLERAGFADPAWRVVENAFELPAGGRSVVLEESGSAEVVGLELHFSPPLTGTLREVLVEIAYADGAPSVRLPVTDLVGMTHPWPVGRWDGRQGTLAAGIQYPWFVREPRYYFPQALFFFHLPMPFRDGLRIELRNRSATTRFSGILRCRLAPFEGADGDVAGRLCARRDVAPVGTSQQPVPVLTVPGRGQLVGLGLFLTGNERFPAAANRSRMALERPGQEPVTGHGLVPLWFMGGYGGPIGGKPVWNHPRMEHRYCGAMRHFVTDPIPFTESATFAYTPGEETAGAPTQATVTAFWYEFGTAAYEAPRMPERAMALPYSEYGPSGGLPPGGGRRTWFSEAEDMVPSSLPRGARMEDVEDRDHNYHPSRGRFLRVTADQPGDYVDCLVPLPPDRYVSVGTLALWGPRRAGFELDLLSRQEAFAPPVVQQGDAFYRGRAVGSVSMAAPVFAGGSLIHHRDSWDEFSPPFRNPARDGYGVLRFICRSKPLDASAHIVKLDHVQIVAPPEVSGEWREFEDLPPPAVDGSVSAWLPKYGDFSWSGWGAWVVGGHRGGVHFQWSVATAMPPPENLLIRGFLPSGSSNWTARVNGAHSVRLAPGSEPSAPVEWSIPLDGFRPPGVMRLEISSPLPPGSRLSAPGENRLVLDAWRLE